MENKGQFKKVLAAAIVATALVPTVQAAETWDTFTRNPDRIMPNPGMLLSDLKHFYGEPAMTHNTIGQSDAEVWDYGTFRTFIADGMVQRSKLW